MAFLFGRSETIFWKFIGLLAFISCSVNILFTLTGQSKIPKSEVLKIIRINEGEKSASERDMSDNIDVEIPATSQNVDVSQHSTVQKEISPDVIRPRSNQRIDIPKSLKDPVWPAISNIKQYLEPSKVLLLGHKRDEKSYVVFGIPTVKRRKAYYVLDTIDWLVKNLKDSERSDVVIVVFVADFDSSYRRKVVEDIDAKFHRDVQDGIIQVVVAPTSYYPKMNNLPLLYGDKPDRVYWRSKQSLDYSFLYYYCADLADYYIQLEDDVLSETDYLSKIKNFIKRKGEDWSILEFGARGFIGMTYRTKHLTQLAAFCRFYFWTMPVDWLFRVFNDIFLYGNQKTNILRPPIFKHIGEYSSLDGQVRKLEDIRSNKGENLRRLYQNKDGNPKASIVSSFEDYVVPNTIDHPYSSSGIFWGKNIKVDDYVEIIFDTLQIVKRIVIHSGTPKYPLDSLEDSEMYATNNGDSGSCRNYELVKRYSDTPLIDYTYPSSRELRCVKLQLKSVRVDDHARRRWLIIREIAIIKD